MQNFWNREPAMIMGFVQAAIVLAVSFGLNLTPGQTAAILAFTAALLAVVTRQQVTPVKAPDMQAIREARVEARQEAAKDAREKKDEL